MQYGTFEESATVRGTVCPFSFRFPSLRKVTVMGTHMSMDTVMHTRTVDTHGGRRRWRGGGVLRIPQKRNCSSLWHRVPIQISLKATPFTPFTPLMPFFRRLPPFQNGICNISWHCVPIHNVSVQIEEESYGERERESERDWQLALGKDMSGIRERVGGEAEH